MAEQESTERFWSRPELVRAYTDAGEALDYEVDAVLAATARATASGPLGLVHVVGVGAGRELAAIRRCTGDARIHAWDISEPMAEACRQHVHHEGLSGITVHHGAIDQIPERVTDPADVIIALGAVLGYGTTPEGRRRDLRALRSSCRTGAGVAAVVQQRNGRPDWSLYFAVTSVMERARLRTRGGGNRASRHGSATVLFHHFGRRELTSALGEGAFAEIEVRSLRQWARARGSRPPLRSPNPLIAVASAV
jgi:hypothetical protein